MPSTFEKARFQISRLQVSREVELSSRPGEAEPHLSLPGHLTIPQGAHGIILFAHGSGSGRLSPRNREIARILNTAGMGTLLFDLLTPEESSNRDKTFEIPLLASRLLFATRWLENWIRERQDSGDSTQPNEAIGLGYLGASTGAAAAIRAATELGTDIVAVVSRGGRPDLAMESLPALQSPTLFIVGGEDTVVLEINRNAQRLAPGSQLMIVPGATHLFEEPGTLKASALHAAGWFHRHFENRVSRALLAG